MALTAEQEASVLALLDVVNGSGGPSALASLIKYGSLTTEIQAFDAKIANKVAEKDKNAQSFDAEIKALRDAKEASIQQLRKLTQG